MTEPFSYEDTQFVADTIGRETIEQAHAILTGLIERGWTPPPATGGLVDPSCLHRVGEDRDCGYLTPGQLRTARERLLDGDEDRLTKADYVQFGDHRIPIMFNPDMAEGDLMVVGSCSSCGHGAVSHTREGCQVVYGFAGAQCPCAVGVAQLATKTTGIGDTP